MNKEGDRKKGSKHTPEGKRDVGPKEQYDRTLQMVLLARTQVKSGDPIANRGMDGLLLRLSESLPDSDAVLTGEHGREVVLTVLKENLKHEGKVLEAKSKKDMPSPHSWQKMEAKFVRGIVYNNNLDGIVRSFLPHITSGRYEWDPRCAGTAEKK